MKRKFLTQRRQRAQRLIPSVVACVAAAAFNFILFSFISSSAIARVLVADNLSAVPDAQVEVQDAPQPTQNQIAVDPLPENDSAEPVGPPEQPADMQGEGPEAYGPPAPDVKEEIYRVETNPCDSKDVKEYLVGNYIIVGQKKSSGGVPSKTDLYTAAANVALQGCKLTITLCTEGGHEIGEMRGILALADKIPMWKIESSTKTGELKEYFLQMTSDLDNYPVLYGWGHQGYEFWRPAHNEQISCP